MTTEEYVKILPRFIELSYVGGLISERIADGEKLADEEKASALLREVAELGKTIKRFCGREPIDVTKPFDLEGLSYDGHECICTDVGNARRMAQRMMCSPGSLEEYEMGKLIYYCSTHQLMRQLPKVATAS